MNEEKVTCLVTIHGIGQQHPPAGGQDGYADGLHRSLLQTSLGDLLLERDPLAPDAGEEPAPIRPIYVVGAWPPQPNAPYGLGRLGTWATNDRRNVDISKAPLRYPDRPVVHLAICYADEQAKGTHLSADLETVVRTALSVTRYATVGTLLTAPLAALGAGARTVFDYFRQQPATNRPATDPTGGISAIFGYLDDDVALYVCRNDLRERVRSFVHDAILRLACRDDVGAVVVNAHSNGTVIAADVLHQLPPVASSKIEWFITAGSPLRKYVDLFDWGTDFFCADTGTAYVPQVQRWTNFWDGSDIVADPLAAPKGWRRGDALPVADPDRLFQVVVPSSAEMAPIEVDDKQVNNVPHVPAGGYPPHNYWDNREEVVPVLADIVRQVHMRTSQAPMVRLAGLK
jgi:hypothetical protein